MGGRSLTEYFGPQRAPAMRTRVIEFAKEFGIDDVRPPDHISNTRKVIALAEFARDQGKLDEFRAAGMDAYWRHGKDLEDDAVLREVAAGVGLDPDGAVAATRDPKYLGRIDERREEANAIGVTGIPTFVIGNQGMVGCQPYEILEAFALDAGAKRLESPS